MLAAVSFAPIVLAQAPADRLAKSPRHQEWVTVKSGSRNVALFVVYPEVSGKAPAVLVIHENMGLTDWVRSVADRLAAVGYIAVAPDLLSGMAPNGGKTSDFPSVDAAREAIYKLPPDQVTGDLNAAGEYVRKLPSANGKLFVSGFCWGGSQSFRYAGNGPGLSAAFVFYGTGPDSNEEAENVKTPVYGFYGGNDNRVTSTVEKTDELMKAAGKTFESMIYKGAGHGFMRIGEEPGATPANQKAHDEAWQRWLGLLKKM